MTFLVYAPNIVWHTPALKNYSLSEILFETGILFSPPKCGNPLLGEQRNYTQLLVASISIYPTYRLRGFYSSTDVSELLKLKEAMAHGVLWEGNGPGSSEQAVPPHQTGGGRKRKGGVQGPAPFPSFSGTCSAEAKAGQPLSGPYQCCLRWRAFAARAPGAGPCKGARPRVGSEPWIWRVLAAALERACLQPYPTHD